MTAKGLIEELQKYPPDTLVLIADYEWQDANQIENIKLYYEPENIDLVRMRPINEPVILIDHS